MDIFIEVKGKDELTEEWVKHHTYIFDIIPAYTDLECEYLYKNGRDMTSCTRFHRTSHSLGMGQGLYVTEAMIDKLDRIYDRVTIQNTHPKIERWVYKRRNPLHHERFDGTVYKHWSLEE